MGSAIAFRDNIRGIPPSGQLDVTKEPFNFSAIPMRLSVSRNIEGFSLVATMSQKERTGLEDLMLTCIDKMIMSPELRGIADSRAPE